MWLNPEQTTDTMIAGYRKALLSHCPHHVVIDNLFNDRPLRGVSAALESATRWQEQRHTYDELYVENTQWHSTAEQERFVRRDVWQRDGISETVGDSNTHAAQAFLEFLRGEAFMALLSRIFDVGITDIHVADPAVNTNYFRLKAADFVRQHADDSPGRQVCMLVYLNKDWQLDGGGELVFAGQSGSGGAPVHIAPMFNRCVLFSPSSKGSEHWVEPLNKKYSGAYRYNVTSWYWSE